MKRKGFTLIELLAVIVILAVIAIIAIPIITNVIDKAKIGSAESSALGYIDALEKLIITNELKNETINDGTYKIEDEQLSKVSYKGKGPTKGQIKVENKEIKSAKLCINNYSIKYEDNKAIRVEEDYCNYEVTFEGLKKEVEGNSTTFNKTITTETNIMCTNEAIPSYENGVITVSNVIGKTECGVYNTLQEGVNATDTSLSNIVMVNDEVASTVKINKEKSITLDLNGKQITSEMSESTDTTSLGQYNLIHTYGNLIIKDSIGTGKIYNGTVACAIVASDGNLIINGGNYDGRYSIIIPGSSKVVINGGKFNTKYQATIALQRASTNANLIINGGIFTSNIDSYRTILNDSLNGNITIKGGIFISSNNSVISNTSTGIININQTKTPIYISSLAKTWKPVIINNSTGTINITANEADKCTNNSSDTKSGLCVYAEGDKNYDYSTANVAIQNVNGGVMNIYGGTYYGGHQTINNNHKGIVNIKNGIFLSNKYAILNGPSGIINICNSKSIKAPFDLAVIAADNENGTIKYTEVVKNNTDSFTVSSKIQNIILDNTITCN